MVKFRFRTNNIIKYLGFTLLFLIIILFYIQNESEKVRTYLIDEEFRLSNTSVPIRIYNFSRALKPKRLYDSLACRKSAYYYVRTILCPHEIRNDVHVSSAILIDGMWEAHVLKPFLDYANGHSDWLVIDVGAQIGEFSLFAAKLGRDVVAIEPFYENIIRFHKAVVAENLQSRIRLITNAISDERGRIESLQKMEDNIGGQYLIRENHNVIDSSDDRVIFSKSDRSWNKYLVETIVFDDIIDFLPLKMPENEPYKKAIMKIDIEGYEPYALSHASKLFDKIDIRVIFMEWGQIVLKKKGNEEAILKMIQFLHDLKYSPHGDNVILEKEDWKTWPWDIIWIKN